MPSHEAAPRTPRLEEIKTPDQLQQAKRHDEADAATSTDPRPEAGDPAAQTEGILGQLRTERAHD